MMCPTCKGDTRVIDSRLREGNAIQRRRVCDQGHRFTTWETTNSSPAYAKHKERNKKHVKKWWANMPEAERLQKVKYYRMRKQARIEAKSTGQDVNKVYERYGVL